MRKTISLTVAALLVGITLFGCKKTYTSTVTVNVSATTKPATQPAPARVPLVFESEARQREMIESLEGKPAGEARKMLASGAGLMRIYATGDNKDQLVTEVNALADKAVKGQLPAEYGLSYTIDGPTRGTLSLRVKDDKVVSATFTPE